LVIVILIALKVDSRIFENLKKAKADWPPLVN